MRLHKANSGSINIDGNEYASKKIPKKIIRKLRNNAQMIFQDPYSSLNSQKNILNIVSEPLIVNKTHKRITNKYLKNRKDILVFFSMELNTFYWDTKWKNSINLYKKRIDDLSDIIKKLKKFKPSKEDVKLTLYNVLIDLYFKTKMQTSIEFVNIASENLEKYLIRWEKNEGKLDQEKLENSNEVDLLKAKKNFQNLKIHLKHSKNTEMLLQKIKQENIKAKDLELEFHEKNKIVRRVILSFINNFKLENKSLKLNISLAKSYGTQNYLKLIMAKNNHIVKNISNWFEKNKNNIFSISLFELNKSIVEVTTKLYIEHFEQFKIDSTKDNILPKKYSDIYKELSKIQWNNDSRFNKFVNEVNRENNSLRKNHLSKLNKIKQKLADLDVEYKSALEEDKKRDFDKLKDSFDKAKFRLKDAATKNNTEKKKFKLEYNDSFEDKKRSKIDLIKSLKTKFKELENQAEVLFKEKMNEVKLTENKFIFKENEKDADVSKVNQIVKNSIKKQKSKLLSFEGEFRRIEKDEKVIKQLYGINFNPFFHRNLRKLLIKMEVFKTLKHVGLHPAHAFRYPHEFSGGMRQRVGIARAIINNPKFIIADEPIAALDLSIQAQVINMLLEQKERLGLAMLFIAHDLTMVRFNSDRVLIMHLGKLVEYGETEEIFKNPKHPYTINLIDTMPSLNNLTQGFKKSSFNATYLEKYSLINKPSYVQVGKKDHFVLADEEQIKEWLSSGKNKKRTKPKLAREK